MLRWRLLLGTILIISLSGWFWLDWRLASPPGVLLFPLALLLSGMASREMLEMYAARRIEPCAAVVYGGNLTIVAASWIGPAFGSSHGFDPHLWLLATFAVAVLAAFVGEMRRYTEPGRVTENLAAAVLALAYVGLLLGTMVLLRFADGGRLGTAALASLVVVVKLGDIGAYTVGRLVGRHRMAPVLSAGKTTEGAAGALGFAVVGSWFCFDWLLPHMADMPIDTAWWRWLTFGIVVGGTGMAGDLAESLLKRDLGLKDSSHWVPGFGGVLDLLDSLLFAAPVAYLCWALGLVGR